MANGGAETRNFLQDKGERDWGIGGVDRKRWRIHTGGPLLGRDTAPPWHQTKKAPNLGPRIALVKGMKDPRSF
ncbi:MAG: hypothetical protein JW883_17245 [Deltaproteobacteria bacterium]|nr:hypothetical protein [Deltaproteobacteria bacterium]